MIILLIAHYHHYRDSYETRQLDYRSTCVPVYAVYRIKSCPRSFLKPLDIRTHTYATLVGKLRGIAISAMAIYSGRTGVLISANDRQNTRLDRLIIPRCRHDNRVGPLRLAADDDHMHTTSILTFYHSHYDVRIYSTLSVCRRTLKHRRAIAAYRFSAWRLLRNGAKAPFYRRGIVLPIKIFVLSRGSKIFICPRDRDPKCLNDYCTNNFHLRCAKYHNICLYVAVFQINRLIENFQLSHRILIVTTSKKIEIILTEINTNRYQNLSTILFNRDVRLFIGQIEKVVH